MYSQSVVEQNISRVEARMRASGRDDFCIARLPADVIDEMVEHLDSLLEKVDSKTYEYQFKRDLTKAEQRFIENELILCQLDWRHYNEQYVYIKPAVRTDSPEGWDDLAEDREDRRGAAAGPLVKFQLNGMQEALLLKLAELEEIAYDQAARGVPVNGILLILLKARQLGASTVWQSLIRHKVNFYSYVNTIVASMDDQSTQALQRRSDIMYEKLPFWMRAPMTRQTIDRGIVFANGSVIELQDSKQKKDLGKGETWHAGHITECSTFDRPEDHFEEGLFPAIDFHKQVLFGMESTAKGKSGWWYEFVTQVMSGSAEGGAGRFSYFFAPFYLIDMAEDSKSKYRLEPPLGWEPSPLTLLMAQTVFDTSHNFTANRQKVRLSKEVLYWYERTRAMYYKRGKLNIFLQSWPATPEEAFQHGAAGAFSNDTVERLQLACARYEPIPYRLASSDELPEVENDPTRPIHHVGQNHLIPMQESELDKDARGIYWFWEQPHDGHEYVVSADPTGGIPGWSREFRQHDDVNTDNAAAGVWRKSLRAIPCEACGARGWNPTSVEGIKVECYECDGRGKLGGRPVQVVEYAAPVDAEEQFPLTLFVLSTLFRGRAENDQALTIIEGNNTGLLTIRKLISKFEHSNLYQHRSLDGMTVKYLNGYGFWSSPQSVPILHARGRGIVVRRNVDIRSRWLVKELSDAVVKVTGEAGAITRERFEVPRGGGRHDDRMTMLFLALWALFDWTESPDSDTAFESAAAELPSLPEFAATDATAEEQQGAWNKVLATLADGQDLNFGHYDDCTADCDAQHPPEDEDGDDDDEDEFGEGWWREHEYSDADF